MSDKESNEMEMLGENYEKTFEVTSEKEAWVDNKLSELDELTKQIQLLDDYIALLDLILRKSPLSLKIDGVLRRRLSLKQQKNKPNDMVLRLLRFILVSFSLAKSLSLIQNYLAYREKIATEKQTSHKVVQLLRAKNKKYKKKYRHCKRQLERAIQEMRHFRPND